VHHDSSGLQSQGKRSNTKC